jgi:malto-oligosyltrehalose trehalohydrolase
MMIERRFGPVVGPEHVLFRLWAPGATRVELLLDGKLREMRATGDGWFKLLAANARAGDRYQFRIDESTDVPDPASRFQPDDVNGPSEVVDSAHCWTSHAWISRPWHECAFLELHVGAFSEAGTFRGVIEKLDHIAETGLTAIELMPVADFCGRQNWGYDGALWFAPDSAYGRPEDLKALVDAAHSRGLMIFLDVVYNHLGPEGNHLAHYAPQFFASADTPWGKAIDYRNSEVRAFAIENALYWLEDFRFDGLRLDAVHAIAEPGRSALLGALSEGVGKLAADTGRHIHLVLENDANQASLLDPVENPPRGKYRAQWNDDYHHSMHVLLTGESQGHCVDYADPAPHLARALVEGSAYSGEPSQHDSQPRGERSNALPLTAFVNFLQNHDQIGNRALGERLVELAPREAIEAALALTLLAPSPPLLFMGEEWGAREPFPFFCDFDGKLGHAVCEGRRRELAQAHERHDENVPDPLSEQTFRQAKLDWAALTRPEHAARLALVHRLLAVRQEFITPRLTALRPGAGRCEVHGRVLLVRWEFDTREELSILANLGDAPAQHPGHGLAGRTIWGGDARQDLRPWAVHAAFAGPC